MRTNSIKTLVAHEVNRLREGVSQCLNCRFLSNFHMGHVKMRSPIQGLGSIPASKKWGSGIDPRVQNMQLRAEPLE